MLTTYLDETGQEQDDWMFIAGYMGSDDAWKQFPVLWAEAIGPQRKHLHMKELRFTKLSVQKMLKKAALVPKECGLIPIVSGVRLKDYAEANPSAQNNSLNKFCNIQAGRENSTKQFWNFDNSYG